MLSFEDSNDRIEPAEYFLQLLLKDLGLSSNQQAKCTEACKCHKLIDQKITHKYSQYIKNNLNHSLDGVSKCLLSNIYI